MVLRKDGRLPSTALRRIIIARKNIEKNPNPNENSHSLLLWFSRYEHPIFLPIKNAVVKIMEMSKNSFYVMLDLFN